MHPRLDQISVRESSPLMAKADLTHGSDKRRGLLRWRRKGSGGEVNASLGGFDLHFTFVSRHRLIFLQHTCNGIRSINPHACFPCVMQSNISRVVSISSMIINAKKKSRLPSPSSPLLPPPPPPLRLLSRPRLQRLPPRHLIPRHQPRAPPRLLQIRGRVSVVVVTRALRRRALHCDSRSIGGWW